MDPLPMGQGARYTDPSADRARDAFAGKPRAMTDKLTTVAEAVVRLGHDGAYLAIGGFGGARPPPPGAPPGVRPGQQNLRLPRRTPPHDLPVRRAGYPTERG